MKLTKGQFDGLNALLAALGLLLVLMFAPTIIFAIKGDTVGVAISLTVIAMLFLGLLVMGSVAVGATYTRRTMQDGANIALQAQDLNDRWDVQKFSSATKLLVEGARAARSIREPEMAPLPMPSQGDLGWMPDVAVLPTGDDGDWVDGDS